IGREITLQISLPDRSDLCHSMRCDIHDKTCFLCPIEDLVLVSMSPYLGAMTPLRILSNFAARTGHEYLSAQALLLLGSVCAMLERNWTIPSISVPSKARPIPVSSTICVASLLGGAIRRIGVPNPRSSNSLPVTIPLSPCVSSAKTEVMTTLTLDPRTAERASVRLTLP